MSGTDEMNKKTSVLESTLGANFGKENELKNSRMNTIERPPSQLEDQSASKTSQLHAMNYIQFIRFALTFKRCLIRGCVLNMLLERSSNRLARETD